MRDRIDLVCPADECAEELGQVIFDVRVLAVIGLECPKCHRPLRFFVNEDGVYRRQWPYAAPATEGPQGVAVNLPDLPRPPANIEIWITGTTEGPQGVEA
jgi:hypothetical protein